MKFEAHSLKATVKEIKKKICHRVIAIIWWDNTRRAPRIVWVPPTRAPSLPILFPLPWWRWDTTGKCLLGAWLFSGLVIWTGHTQSLPYEASRITSPMKCTICMLISSYTKVRFQHPNGKLAHVIRMCPGAGFKPLFIILLLRTTANHPSSYTHTMGSPPPADIPRPSWLV